MYFNTPMHDEGKFPCSLLIRTMSRRIGSEDGTAGIPKKVGVHIAVGAEEAHTRKMWMVFSSVLFVVCVPGNWV